MADVWELAVNRLTLAKRLKREGIVYVQGEVGDALCRSLAAGINISVGSVRTNRYRVDWEPVEGGYRLMLVDTQVVADMFRDAAIALGMPQEDAVQAFRFRR